MSMSGVILNSDLTHFILQLHDSIPYYQLVDQVFEEKKL